MSDSFDLGEPPQPKETAYRVLARKYRPQNFDQLIGQDAMVQTLGNAIRRGRLAHAFLLTGVRGVGLQRASLEKRKFQSSNLGEGPIARCAVRMDRRRLACFLRISYRREL